MTSHQENVNNGEACPKCPSKNIKCLGSAPDGFNENNSYACDDCGKQWEGY